jgi:type IV secretory pathway TrbD component
MLKNVGSADRNIRILLGIAIIIVGVVLQSWWGLIGLLPLLTAGLSFCPLYSLLGTSTCKK